MTVSDWIQAGTLFLALVALIFQQRQQLDQQRQQQRQEFEQRNQSLEQQRQQLEQMQRSEKRIETKLKIFFICQKVPRSDEEIIRNYKSMNPTEKVDEIEIRKALYEMLNDGTLRYRTNGTFKARMNKAKEDQNDDDI
jgi:hypothetical protein